MIKMATNQSSDFNGSEKVGQHEAEQLDSGLLAALTICALVMTVSEWEPDGGATSCTAIYRDWLFGWRRCQQPTRGDTWWGARIL